MLFLQCYIHAAPLTYKPILRHIVCVRVRGRVCACALIGDNGELSIVLFISILIYVSFHLRCTKQSSSYLQCKPLKSAYRLQGSTIRMLFCQANTLHFDLPCKHFVWHHQKCIVDNSLSHTNGCTWLINVNTGFKLSLTDPGSTGHSYCWALQSNDYWNLTHTVLLERAL